MPGAVCLLPWLPEVEGGAGLLQGCQDGLSHLHRHPHHHIHDQRTLSKVTMKSLEETVKEQGGEEFLAMVKEVSKSKMDFNGGKLPVASPTDQVFAPWMTFLSLLTFA